jgi:hypothetical protein
MPTHSFFKTCQHIPSKLTECTTKRTEIQKMVAIVKLDAMK